MKKMIVGGLAAAAVVLVIAHRRQQRHGADRLMIAIRKTAIAAVVEGLRAAGVGVPVASPPTPTTIPQQTPSPAIARGIQT